MPIIYNPRSSGSSYDYPYRVPSSVPSEFDPLSSLNGQHTYEQILDRPNDVLACNTPIPRGYSVNYETPKSINRTNNQQTFPLIPELCETGTDNNRDIKCDRINLPTRNSSDRNTGKTPSLIWKALIAGTIIAVLLAILGICIFITIRQGNADTTDKTSGIKNEKGEYRHFWTQWGSCNSTCGRGLQLRKRLVCGSPKCLFLVHNETENRQCASAKCPGDSSSSCVPNEMMCDNGRCVQKTWVCDGDDDCGDLTDERSCQTKPAGALCQTFEFECDKRRQCIPKSSLCDKHNDCKDGSDEIGCRLPEVSKPPPSSLRPSLGETITIRCTAIGRSKPLITWRKNWGHVCPPPRCTQTSTDGNGVLTITDANMSDSGNYTCEAINIRGRILAVPDCIVDVVDPVPVAYFVEPEVQYVRIGGHAEFRCVVTGDTGGEESTLWMTDAFTDVVPGDGVYVDNAEGTLLFDPVTVDHFKSYFCVVALSETVKPELVKATLQEAEDCAVYSEWGDWSYCEGKCGMQNRERFRMLVEETTRSGVPCSVFDFREMQPCSTQQECEEILDAADAGSSGGISVHMKNLVPCVDLIAFIFGILTFIF